MKVTILLVSRRDAESLGCAIVGSLDSRHVVPCAPGDARSACPAIAARNGNAAESGCATRSAFTVPTCRMRDPAQPAGIARSFRRGQRIHAGSASQLRVVGREQIRRPAPASIATAVPRRRRESRIQNRAASAEPERRACNRRARLDFGAKAFTQTIGRIARRRMSAPARQHLVRGVRAGIAPRACALDATLIRCAASARETPHDRPTGSDRLESGVQRQWRSAQISLDLRGACTSVHAVIADQRAVVAADDPRVRGPEQAVRRIEHMRLHPPRRCHPSNPTAASVEAHGRSESGAACRGRRPAIVQPMCPSLRRP